MGCRPSASCFACKVRKVKCDLRKPSCNRCTGLGRPCPGYADPWAMMHRQQNASAAHQVETRVARRLKEREDSKTSNGGGANSPGSSSAAAEEERRWPAVPKPFQVDPELVSLNKFHSTYASAGEVAMFAMLPGLTSAGNQSAVFDEVLRATALASSSLQMQQSGLMVRAKQHYRRAIMKIGAALQNPATAQDDSVVVALLTLGIYEALIPDSTPKKITSHCRGSLVLLRYRAEQGVASSLDNGLLTFLIHLGILETFIGLYGRSSVLPVVKNAPWARHCAMEPLLERAMDFKETICNALLSIETWRSSVPHILQTGLDIIRDLEAAANYSIMSPGPRKTGADEQGLNNFNGLLSRKSYASEAIVRGLYLTVRLHVLEYILGLSMALGELTREELSMLASLPHGLSALEQVCEQIRVVFGFDGREPASRELGIGFSAWCMFWPMLAVLKSGFADNDTRLWVMDKCATVSRASGFGMAMYQMGWFEQKSCKAGATG
ncbi:Putative zn(2)Cys(6) fungal-type DNA-binding domain-containing protein [Colletotrichum destructivum]|uniref:Zn(2)Cys(6) fungal-type DNA-binding domain-containing protein n=1 Tax=Colletotrichum destructivum TaxID=34406 RepID=A0AAX4ITN3_9PEZI|nr:Putative zn(2)Cys(6) fungal-type DNA-binding domain-containing protein [Colletotrichum destructivum]